MYKKIVNWYLTRRALPLWCVLFVDCLAVLLSGFMAYAVNHGLAHTVGDFGTLWKTLGAYLLCFIVGFRILSTYNCTMRSHPASDLLRLGLALLTGVAFVMLLRIFLHADALLLEVRFRDLLLQVLLTFTLMSMIRVTVRLFNDFLRKRYAPAGVYGMRADRLLHMEMADLLPRDPIHVDMDEIGQTMRGRRILVTGAAGSIGSELVRQLAAFQPASLILIDQAETPLHDIRMMMRREWPSVSCATIVTSVCHAHRMESIFRRHRPEMVFHAAAYKHVPMMEDNVVESILNNVDGTRKLADLAVHHGVRCFVMVSTDKAVNPTNVMGCSKRICEIYCQSLARTAVAHGCRFVTTRFGNVLGSNGSVIPIFREQIRRGGPVQVTHPDIIRYFMLIPEACQLVLEAATVGRSGEILVFDMGRPVRIADLARRMIALSGRDDIRIEYVGLRPGEKLFEEMLNDGETVLPTRHKKIKVARVREYDFEEVRQGVDELIATARTYDAEATLALMRRLVPEYVCSHHEEEAIKSPTRLREESGEGENTK